MGTFNNKTNEDSFPAQIAQSILIAWNCLTGLNSQTTVEIENMHILAELIQFIKIFQTSWNGLYGGNTQNSLIVLAFWIWQITWNG